jgi:hypothetical protein
MLARQMCPMRTKRSVFVTIVGMVSITIGVSMIAGLVLAHAWDPHSWYWAHSDGLWAPEPEPTATREEWGLFHAQLRAQALFENVLNASSVVIAAALLTCAFGLLRRRNWGRLVILGVLAATMLLITWGTVLLASVELTRYPFMWPDLTALCLLGLVTYRLHSPLIAREFSA